MKLIFRKNVRFKKLRRFTPGLLALTLMVSLIAMNQNPKSVFKQVSAAEANINYGDVNSDGRINIVDMLSMKSYLVENNKKNFSEKAADVDADGKVSCYDAEELAMYMTNEISLFSYIEKTDSDEDGICDYYEKEILKSNYLKADTDGDGVTDYEEVFYTNTDPLIKDTVTKELLDIDDDGLTNIEEIKNKTNPLCKDTDSDGINDYDEINTYKTNPIISDSDKDGISDGGEVKLKTDPNKDSSSEIFEQILPADSTDISTINSSNNQYDLSIKVKAGGFAEESISVSKSEYSDFLAEEEIFGEIIDVKYDNKFKLEEMVITFDLKNITEPKDYMIFKYNPESTMLLPVETQYDNNKLIFTDSECGTYCVANIVQIKTANEIINDLENIESEFNEDINNAFAYEFQNAKASNSVIELDCQFYVDDSTCSVISWNEISLSLISAVYKLERDYKLNIKLEFFAYGYAVNISCSDSSRLREICSTASVFFDDPSVNTIYDAYDYYTTMKSTKTSDVWNELSTYYTPNSANIGAKEIVLSFNPTFSGGSTCGFAIGNSYCRAYNRKITAYSKSFKNKLNKADGASEKIYTIVTYSDKIDTKNSIKISLFSKVVLASALLKNSKTDTDGDGKPDSSEIDLSKLVTLDTIIGKSKSYSNGASQFKNSTGIDITTESVYPIISDPSKEDTDGDGLVDARDASPKNRFDDRFYVDTKLRTPGIASTIIYELQKESDARYAIKKPGEDGVSADRLVNIGVRARANSGALAARMFNSVRFLNHFLNNTGDTLYYNANQVTQKSTNGYYNYAQNINLLRALCESTVVDEVYFNMKYDCLLPGTQFSTFGGDTNIDKDWWYSIGDASASASIRCEKHGDTYYADVIYEILDFYDWKEGSEDRGGFVTDGEMAILHMYGEAKEMASVGEYTTSFTWKKGDRLSTELK